MDIPVAIGGHRLLWSQLPDAVRTVIESAAGDSVVSASSRPGGFSPALASMLTLANGSSVFAKAVTAERSDFGARSIRREAVVLAALPARVNAPGLIWSGDLLDESGTWAIVLTEAIDGWSPAQPWRPAELRRYLDAASVLADALNPAPMGAKAMADHAEAFTNWSDLEHPRASELAVLEAHWAEATAGPSLLHGDLRADNFLITSIGFAVVDWPSACIGAPWLDLLLGLPSVAMHGGGDPDDIWQAHPLSRGVPGEAVDAVLAGMAGYLLSRSMQEPSALLPTLPAFQRAQADVTLRWLTARRGWR
ncbi:aminoglycoside phosphotransferase (APT) family kinase protein [Hamadaea flava]|uniref:Phosphotransferase family protein n=1 Tax=Hamadaea flava TaxID=1742688 RepID=A0ABV8LKS7_9ACTN|nr:phosphotransferase [Hamadaea flava]MCP2323541.1 aminoglycoside phosphotransferase (APT) family kinase protein [Hamadaea flava]